MADRSIRNEARTALPDSRQLAVEINDRRALLRGLDLGGAADARWGDQLAWLRACQAGLRHEPYVLVALDHGQPCGILALAFVRSRLFGKFLVSLPYVNSAGILAETSQAATALVEGAVALADRLDVRFLQLRHEAPVAHAALRLEATTKVHMRRPLPASIDAFWATLAPKVRNQIRKAGRHPLTTEWGREDVLNDFYRVFSTNMRDLGTPVFGRRLFQSILQQFPAAEFCLVRLHDRPVAAALTVPAPGTTEVTSAGSLRAFNSTCANMLLYWHLLRRAVQRGSRQFDFGRSSLDSGAFRFKKQWGAVPTPAVWQSYVRRGDPLDLRPESPRHRRLRRMWRRLPVPLTRLLGPPIVRGIP